MKKVTEDVGVLALPQGSNWRDAAGSDLRLELDARIIPPRWTGIRAADILPTAAPQPWRHEITTQCAVKAPSVSAGKAEFLADLRPQRDP